jgi:hypothetical protein
MLYRGARPTRRTLAELIERHMAGAEPVKTCFYAGLGPNRRLVRPLYLRMDCGPLTPETGVRNPYGAPFAIEIVHKISTMQSEPMYLPTIFT